MEAVSLDMASNALQVVVLLGILLSSLKVINHRTQAASLVFYLFGVTVLLVSDIYWMVHLLMAREAIYPFSAIDVSDTGICLLFGSALEMASGGKVVRRMPMLASTIGFAAANALLWMAWTGEWVKDLIGGIALWYLLYVSVHKIIESKALTRLEWWTVALLGVAVIPLQVGALLDLGGQGSLFDTINGFVWLIGFLILLTRFFRCEREVTSTNKLLSLSFFGYAWTLCAMFLSFEPFYSIMVVCSTVMIVCMYLSMLKRVEEP